MTTDLCEIFDREKALEQHKNQTCDPSLCWYCQKSFGLTNEPDEHEQGIAG